MFSIPKMERTLPVDSATLLLFLLITAATSFLYASASQELLLGFKSTPSPTVSSFQPLLNDPTGNFSLGFLRVNKTQLTLSVIHFPTLQPIWQASPSLSFSWSDRTTLFFNGSLVISDPHSGVSWSSGTSNGERVILLTSSNLQIIGATATATAATQLVVWESFDFPSNTIVQNQNFTTGMSLVSSNGRYSMRLGDNFIGLYAKFRQGPSGEDQIYFRHKALEAKARVVDGAGPIYARVDPDGFLGMYQNGTTPVDIESFNSFQRPVDRFLLVRLETDGNLKGYSWAGPGGPADWQPEYQAIRDTCELPSPCGPYSLCTSGSGCSCLDNRTEFASGSCIDEPVGGGGGDLCHGNDFWILRRKGVDLPFKELMRSKTTPSLEDCEGLCEKNCSCWGAVYNNVSGFCYFVDYPIQTMLGVGDESKIGYFKVRVVVEEKKTGAGFWVGVGLLCGLILILIGGVGFGSYKMCVRRRGVRRILEEEGGVSPGPYKDLGSASFKSIEMYSSSSSR